MADYLLDITNTADTYLHGLEKKFYKQVAAKVLSLMNNPYPNDSILLKGQKRKLHRVDIGEYRIVYSVVGNVVRVETIDKRNDSAVYKHLS